VGSSLKELSSAAFGAVVGVLPDGRDLTVGLRHKSLQLFFKKLVGSFGRGGRCGRGAGGSGLTGGSAAEIVPGCAAFPLGLGLQPLDGQVDLAIVCADDHHFHILTFGQVLADVADIGVGNLRNMYHAALVFRQGDERAKIGDGFDFTF